MAKKPSSSKKLAHQSPKKRQQQIEIPALHPETKKWVVGISFFVIASISTLALFNLAGVGGRYLLQFMQMLFGVLAFLFPLIIFIAGYVVIYGKKLHLSPIIYIGGGLMVLSITALFNIFVPLLDIIDVVRLGGAGGYVGLILSYALMNVVGFIASLIILLATTVIGLMLVVNSSIDELADQENFLGRLLANIQSRWYDLRYGDWNQSEEDGEEEYEDTEDIQDDIDEEEVEDTGFVIKKLEPEISQHQQQQAIPLARKQEEPKEKKKIIYKKVDIPLELLENSSGTAMSGNPIRTKEKIKATLGSFNIPVEMGEVNVGPTVTQYELIPADGIKLSRITALQDDLALSLAAHPLRIEAPIPGKSAVGVEIPNTSVEMVRLKELLQSKSFRARTNALEVALGKDVSGRTWSTPLDAMPHLLVAGATGSGKSVCINTIIISLLYQNGPETLRFIMVDPKKVELSAYADIPHLLTPVITDIKKTVNALKWAVAEMDRRYTLLQKANKRNIQTYNTNSEEKLPYIVFIVDEMADLMIAARNEVESLIIRLAQMARAVGIHLVVATQRPSVDVITGLIKANIPTRIAFAVASSMDSRTILDTVGAEKLVGKGDMLFSNPKYKKPVRIQGAFLSEEEVERVTNYIRERSGAPEYMEEVTNKGGGANGGVGGSDEDDLFDDAKEIVIMAGKASTSFLQRKLKIGYSRAARLMDLLEDAGIVGSSDGAKPREILVSKDDVYVDDISGYDVQDEEVQPSYEEYEEANTLQEDVLEEEELDDALETLEELEETEGDEGLEETENEEDEERPTEKSKKSSYDEWLE